MVMPNQIPPFDPLRIKPVSPLNQVRGVLNELIDFNLALAAMCMERGVFTQEHLFKMESIIKEARRKLGPSFDIQEGMKAVRSAFRIEIKGEGK